MCIHDCIILVWKRNVTLELDTSNRALRLPLGPLHTQGKGCDHVITRALWLPSKSPYQLSKALDFWHCMWKFVSNLPLGDGLDANSNKPWNIIHSMPCRDPCVLFVHDNFFEPLSLHLLTWRELERSRPFRSMRDLRMQWSRALNLVCEVTLSLHKKIKSLKK
jgi:hypothetical protein